MKLSLPTEQDSPYATSVLATAATASLVGLSFYYYYYVLSSSSSKTRNNKKKSLPDAPGGMFEKISGFGGPEAPFFILNLAQQVGSWNYRATVPGISFYIIGDYKLSREILLDSSSDKPRDIYKAFQGTAAKTMFTSSNDAYSKSLRKATIHAFSRNEVGRMNTIARKYVDEWLNGRLAQFAKTGQPFDPAHEFNRITFFVICEAAFEYLATEQDFEEFAEHSEKVQIEFITKVPYNPLRNYFWWFIPSASEARKSCDLLLDFAGRVLTSYRNKPLSERSTSNTLIKILDSKNTSMMIANDHQRKSEMKDWLTGGHDTTGYSLASISTLLAKHPNFQTKLRNELAKCAKNIDSTSTSSTNASTSANKIADNCSYFRNVVKEAMRVMPVAAGGSGRVTGKDYHLKDGTILPKGASCFCNQYLMNHNPSVYGKDFEQFVPERWESPTEEMKVAMAPFAAGSRSCPGQPLAMSEINSALPRLLEQYSLELVDEGKPAYFLTLKYKGTQLRAKKL